MKVVVDSCHDRLTTCRRPTERPGSLKIQEVASELGLTTRSIRYYEELGLLSPAARSDGAYRLYDASDIDRLRFIKGLRDDAGFSLAEISQLLEDEAARVRSREAFSPYRRSGRAAGDRGRLAGPRRAPGPASCARRSPGSSRWSRPWMPAMSASAGALADLDAGGSGAVR